MHDRISRRQWLKATAGSSAAAVFAPLVAAAVRAGVKAEQIGTNLPFLGMDLFSGLDLLHEMGFQGVEPPTWGDLRPAAGRAAGVVLSRLTDEEKEKVKRSIKRFPRRSVHLPFAGLVVVSDDKDLQARSRRIMEEALETAGFLEIELAVIHCLPPRGVPRKEGWPQLIDLYRSWGDRAAELGFRLGVETGYPGNVRDFVKFVQDVNHSHVGATIDVGHQIRYPEFRNRFGKKIPNTPEAYRAYNDVIHLLIDELGEKLWHFHIHDINPTTWREHQPLVHGVIDYPRLFAKLAETSFKGMLVFEINSRYAPPPRMPEVLRASYEKVLSYL